MTQNPNFIHFIKYKGSQKFWLLKLAKSLEISIYLYFYLSAFLSIIYLSIHLSILYIYISLHLSIYTSIHLSIYEYIHLTIYLSKLLKTASSLELIDLMKLLERGQIVIFYLRTFISLVLDDIHSLRKLGQMVCIRTWPLHHIKVALCDL